MWTKMELLFKLAGLAIVVTVIQSLLNQAGRQDFSYLALIAGIVVALLWVVPTIGELFATVKSVFQLY